MRLTLALLRGQTKRGDSHIWKFRMMWRDKAQYKEKTILEPSFVKHSGLSAFCYTNDSSSILVFGW